MRPVIVALIAALAGVQAFGQAPVQSGPPPQGSPAQPAQPPPPLVNTGLIVGRVIDPSTGQGIPGALVMITGSAPSAPMRGQPAAPRPSPPPPPPRYLTDAEGRFAFRNLTRGSYVVTATKQGYADGAHGRVRPSGPTRPILLDDGERVGEVLIRLFRFGAIAGVVTDEAGEPVVGAQVRAYRRMLMAGRRVFAPFGGNAATDDRGTYRFGNLTPGEYVVAVPIVSTSMPNGFIADPRAAPNFEATMFVPGNSGISFGGSGRQVTPDGRFVLQTTGNSSIGPTVDADGRIRANPTTFYPGARTISAAQPISIESGEERLGVDIALPLLPAANVSGQLVSPEGPAAGYALHLVPADSEGLAVDQSAATAVTASDGTFMFMAVPAGQYRLQTTRAPRPAPPPPPPPPPPPTDAGRGGRGGVVGSILSRPPDPAAPVLWASLPISVGDADVDGVIVMLQEGLEVSGRLEFDGTAERPPAARMSQIPVVLEPADGRQRVTTSMPARPQADGRFTTAGVPAGKYFLRIGGAPGGWVFRSAMLNGVDIADVPFTLDRDVSGVIVTFTDRPTELRATVSVPSGQPSDAAVVIFPADNDAWRDYGVNQRRMRMGRVGANGTLSLGSPPPGEYYVVAIREELAVEWQDPRFLDQLARVASRVSLGEGEKKTVDVPFHDVRPPGGDMLQTAQRDPRLPRDPLIAEPGDQDGGERDPSGPFAADDAGPQVRDRPIDSAKASGSISGVVVLEGSNTPVRRAIVRLSSSEIRIQRSTATDDTGRFVLQWLPQGRYTLFVTKPAHLNSYYGARRMGRGPGTPIAVVAGQQVTGVTVPMQRGGVVTGTVFDAYGQPYAGARVRLMQYVTRNGERVLQQTGLASGPGLTDDRGNYRLYGIMPGSYVVSVAAPTISTSSETRQLSSEEINAALSELRQSSSGRALGDSGTQVNPPGRTIAPAPPGQAPQPVPLAGRALGYAPFFYPGTPLEHDAVTIAVAAGQEITGVDIPMRLVPTARIEGVLVGPGGGPPTRVSMSLVSSSSGTTTTSSVRVQADGRFLALGVPPGRYTITARMMEQPPPRPAPTPGAPPVPPVPPVLAISPEGPRLTYWAEQDIDVNGEDITDLSLTLVEGMTVSGRVAFDAHTEKPPAQAGGVRVSLEALSPNRIGFSARPALIDENGAFTITGVTPGRYRLNAFVVTSPQTAPASASGPTGPRWMLKSVIVSGQDAIDTPIELRAGEHISGAVLTMTDRVAELSGAIVDAAGAPVPDLMVVLFPTDRRFWTNTVSRRMRSPMRSIDGKYRLTALLPGEYFLAVITEIEPADWGDPAYMEQLAAASITLTIAEGEKKVQDVRVGR